MKENYAKVIHLAKAKVTEEGVTNAKGFTAVGSSGGQTEVRHCNVHAKYLGHVRMKTQGERLSPHLEEVNEGREGVLLPCL